MLLSKMCYTTLNYILLVHALLKPMTLALLVSALLFEHSHRTSSDLSMMS